MFMQSRLINDLLILTVSPFAHEKGIVFTQQHSNGSIAFVGKQLNALGRAELIQPLQNGAYNGVNINQGHAVCLNRWWEKGLIMTGDDPGADNIGMRFDLGDHIIGNRRFDINDIVADYAVALIDITRNIYIV